MTVIDLALVRAHLDATERAGRQTAEDLARFLVNTALAQAERAFAVSGPISNADIELACIINRGVLRRLRAQVRERARGLDAESQRTLVAQAERVFSGRLIALEDELNAGGRDRAGAAR